jgi:uncharacterized protein YutE (UPF0331/DUF86 family)
MQIIKLFNEFIVAVSHFAWPIATLIIIFLFRKDISMLLRRIRKGKLFGQEMELDPEIKEFGDAVKLAQGEIQESPLVEEIFNNEVEEQNKNIKEIIDASKVNPQLGIIRLSTILEKSLRTIGASLGVISANQRISVIKMFQNLEKKGKIKKNTNQAVKIFWELRNKIVHGHQIENEREILKVLDDGMSLLNTVTSIPHEKYIILHSGVSLYTDPECENTIKDATGVIVEITSSNKIDKYIRIFPTTSGSYYKIGMRVTWEWNMEKTWGKAWFKDPENNDIKSAWGSAAEFIGKEIID